MKATDYPDPSLPWPTPMSIVAMMAEKEQGPNGGAALVAYRCPAGRWTWGWGETEGVTPETVGTKEDADRRFCQSLTKFVGMVTALCTVAPSQNELGAMTSLAYNIGIHAFERSSVLKAHNRGDHQAAARAFALWNKARVNGVLQVLNGLTARRALEASIYLTPDSGHERMPQAVEAESKMSASPIHQAGTGVTLTGLVSAAHEWGGQVTSLKPMLDAVRSIITDTLGIPPAAVLPLMLIGFGLATIYWRRTQRRDGWA